ncbi:hypothetical protein [Fibrella aestuarina]|nr:hypothetical protein [Fibrella aestuarina]
MNELEILLDELQSIKERLSDYVSQNATELDETDPVHEALHSMDDVIDWMEQAVGTDEDG